MKKKLVLFGIDGATFSIIDTYREQLPTFNYVINNGARGNLLSTVPAVTVAAWTSMFTGVNPGKHGITDFILKRDRKFVLATSHYRMVDTVWQMMSKRGLRVMVVNEPATYPPDAINGVMTTGLMTPPGANYVYPQELKNDIDRAAGGYWTDLPLEYYHTVNKDDNKAYSMIEEFANKTAKVGNYLARNYEWDVLAVIFVSTDKIQHTLWHRPTYVAKHYMQIDNILKGYLDIANGENANLLITSDHGFGPLQKTFYINTWLSRAGLQKRKTTLMTLLSRMGMTPSNIAFILKKLHIYGFVLRNLIKTDLIVDVAFQYDRPIDLINSVAFAKAEGIFINMDNRSDYAKTRELIIKQLEGLMDNGTPVVKKVYRREEVINGKYTERAPDILFILNDGYCPTYYSDGLDSQYIGNDRGGYKGGTANTGIHRPEGIFMAYGPDIRKCEIDAETRVWDIAPTMLHLMGLPVPAYMDGHVLKNVFKSNSNLAGREIVETMNEVDRIKMKLQELKFSR
ncbi:MAG: alkaline phosphatase family protein [Nitrososphaerales archaeon]